MAAHELTPTSYIGHHLANQTVSFGDSPFWTLHVDTLVTSVILGVVAFGLLWLVVRGATAGVPGKRQAFVELAVNFVDDQVKGIFHGDRSFIAPLALTVFVWVILMNAMDFLPVDIMAWIYEHVFHQANWRHVPTADARVLPGGTAHITDVGMCGALDSSLGVTYDSIIPRWRDGSRTRNLLATTGPRQFNAVLVEVDSTTGLSKSIAQVQKSM